MESMRFYCARVLVWIIVYLLFICGPLFALMLGSWPPARDFWTEFSVALGYAGLAMMGLQFGLTARFRYITQPWGDDLIYHVHRQLSIIAVCLVIAHPLILFVVQPEFLALLNTFTAPWRARFAAVSVYSLIAIVIMAVWRTKLKLSYETWHISHMLLAVVAVATGVFHMVGWGYYLASRWKRGLWIGMSVFWVGLLFYVRVIKPWFLIRRPYRVAAVRKERGDTHTLVMQPEGHPGFRFIPGQFGWLTVWQSPFKASGHPFVFSSSAAVSDGRVEMSIRSLGDFTNTIHAIPVGKRVYLDGPYGTFTVGDAPALHVLIAGGVGIAPMMSIIRTFADRGDERPIILVYGSRDWESVTFREELEALKPRLNLTIVHVLDDPPDGWTGERGFITAEVLKRHLPPSYADHEYFICGHDMMMDATERILDELNVPISRYHSEPPSFV
jgi:predicted ferric reductase